MLKSIKISYSLAKL